MILFLPFSLIGLLNQVFFVVVGNILCINKHRLFTFFYIHPWFLINWLGQYCAILLVPKFVLFLSDLRLANFLKSSDHWVLLNLSRFIVVHVSSLLDLESLPTVHLIGSFSWLHELLAFTSEQILASINSYFNFPAVTDSEDLKSILCSYFDGGLALPWCFDIFKCWNISRIIVTLYNIRRSFFFCLR